MRHLLLLALALGASQPVTAQQGSGLICRNDFDCATDAWCDVGTCRFTATTPPWTPTPGDSGFMCRSDWDCGQGEVCSAGSCSYIGGGSSSDGSSDGGSTPIFGG